MAAGRVSAPPARVAALRAALEQDAASRALVVGQVLPLASGVGAVDVVFGLEVGGLVAASRLAKQAPDDFFDQHFAGVNYAFTADFR